MSGDDIGIVRRMCEGGNGVFHDACLAVCDEVERLRAEVERTRDYACRMDALAEERLMRATRLRAAGDALVDAVERQQWSTVDVAIAAWKEARRG